MITLKDFLEAIEYRISEGSDYGWKCYGPNARYLDAHGPTLNSDYSIHAIFDSKDQTVYAVEAWDYRNDREYRWISPYFQKAYKKECKKKDVDPKESMDGRTYIELEVEEDILEKINAIVNNLDYDTRIKVPVDFSDEDLLQYMKLAHERDMTFNQFVEEALSHALAEVDAGRLTKEDAQKFVEENYSEI